MPKEQISSNDYSVKKVHRLQTLIHIRKLPVLPKYRNLSKIRNSKRQHASTYTFYVPKHIGTHVVMVAPVVSTSSTNKICFPTKTFGIAKMKDAVHILPSFIGRFACLRFRMFLAHYGRGGKGIPVTAATPLATHSLWLYPRIRCLRGCKGTRTIASTSQKELRNSQFRCHKALHCLSKSLRPPYFN